MTSAPRDPSAPWDDGAPMPSDDDFAVAPDWEDALAPDEPTPESSQRSAAAADLSRRHAAPARRATAPRAPTPRDARPAASAAGEPRPPTEKQLAFARKLAAERKQSVPAEALTSSTACSRYIDGLLGSRSAAPSPAGSGGAARAPSEKQLAFARRLAEEKKLPLTDADTADSRAISRFIDRALGKG